MKHSLSFYGPVTAGNRITLVSLRLNFPYVIEQIRVKYALGQNAKIQHSFFVSDDPAAPTGAQPTGLNLLAQYGPVDYTAGDDDVAIIPDNTIVDRMGTYFKVHAYNTDTFDHNANVIITIDDMRIHPSFKHLSDLLAEVLSRGASGL